MKQKILVPLLLAIATLLVLVPPAAMAGASIGASASVKVNLSVAPGGMYLVGKPAVPIVSPHRITIGLWQTGKLRTRVFGLGSGRVVFVGARARPFVLVGAPIAVVAPGAAVVGAPGVVVGAPAVVVGVPAVVVQPPSVVVGVPGVVVVTPGGKHDNGNHHGHHKGHKGKGKHK